ncbi:hypothetical protein [Salinicoccus bachuensis]|uniref:YusW-like protein n=1 Tax=Salinicoccus bachuensis TaxID=3136731 RepID=A0ABZ3CJ49_9STAP
MKRLFAAMFAVCILSGCSDEPELVEESHSSISDELMHQIEDDTEDGEIRFYEFDGGEPLLVSRLADGSEFDADMESDSRIAVEITEPEAEGETTLQMHRLRMSMSNKSKKEVILYLNGVEQVIDGVEN